ncbi:MAG: cytochrome-c peroxidase, partial [Bacteroidales bacterium]
LGRYLFYDGRLSGRLHKDSLMSCANCHIQKNNFEAGVNHPKSINGHPIGLTGKATPHVTMGLINLVWNFNGYGWNGFLHPSNPNPKKRELEDFVWMSVLAKHEIAGDTNKVKNILNSIPEYKDLFFKAFGSSDIKFDYVCKAIAQFIRTLISANSKFDKYLRGEVQLSPEELRGFVLFGTEEGADCFHCHGGGGNPLFTTNKFYNNGKDVEFTGENQDPRDRFSYTKDPMDLGAYKAPTLRNIEVCGPYMHDGRFETLERVIEFYSHEVKNSKYIDPLMHHVANQGIQLTQSEKKELISFIKTLRDDEFLNNSEHSKPQRLPGDNSGN